jgi:hypothetical protein
MNVKDELKKDHDENIDMMRDLKNKLEAVLIKEEKSISSIIAADIPDPKKHKIISFAKSGLRIIACGFLAYYEIQAAAVLFLIAEILGVAEELV